jgi:outer membrane protein assembly factor BamB
MARGNQSLTLDEVLFVGFNRRVAALSKHTGEILWKWKAPAGTGFVTLLVEADRVYVAVHGHTYCLDAATGEQLWHNPMDGFGYGVTCLATIAQHTDASMLAEADGETRRRRQVSNSGA